MNTKLKDMSERELREVISASAMAGWRLQDEAVPSPLSIVRTEHGTVVELEEVCDGEEVLLVVERAGGLVECHWAVDVEAGWG